MEKPKQPTASLCSTRNIEFLISAEKPEKLASSDEVITFLKSEHEIFDHFINGKNVYKYVTGKTLLGTDRIIAAADGVFLNTDGEVIKEPDMAKIVFAKKY